MPAPLRRAVGGFASLREVEELLLARRFVLKAQVLPEE